MKQTADQALGDPLAAQDTMPSFFDRVYPHDGLLSPILLQLRQVCAGQQPESGWLVEQFHHLGAVLYRAQQHILSETASVPAARAATRHEIYRRLYHARDYADAFYTTPITIDQMASAAGISANHLLRMFRQVFHLSPYQYITARRVAHAQALLANSDMPVTEICLTVGFESLGAFSWLFRRRVGLSPSAYRLQNR